MQQSKRDYSITSSARVGASTNLGCIHREPPATLATTAQVKLTLLDRQWYEFLNVDRIVDAFWAVVVDLIVYRKHNTLRLTLLLRGINQRSAQHQRPSLSNHPATRSNHVVISAKHMIGSSKLSSR